MRIVLSNDVANPIVGRGYVDEDAFANASEATFVECVRGWEQYVARMAAAPRSPSSFE
jgi:hypothetical protein